MTKADIKVYGFVTEKSSGSFPNVVNCDDIVPSSLAVRYVLFC